LLTAIHVDISGAICRSLRDNLSLSALSSYFVN